MDLIDSITTKALAKAMDGVSQRHTAILSNIANAETPGYKATRVSFEENLSQAIQAEESGSASSKFLPTGSLKTTNPLHFNPNPVASSLNDAQASISQSGTSYRQDKNGVDIDSEMAQLAKNTQRFLALSNLESKNYGLLRDVIKGGGG